jgi:LmbE family N-acetylglucosaminyl deacetylase
VVPEVWLQGGPAERTTTYVDATDAFEAKLAALRAHVSQTEHMDDLEALLRSWMTGVAWAGKLGPGRLAEGFQVLDTGE